MSGGSRGSASLAVAVSAPIFLAAALLGGLLGAILIGIKLLRARYDIESIPDFDALRVTPHRKT